MMNLQYAVMSIILIFIRSVANTAAKSSCPKPIVGREILKNGFHRDLVTRVNVQGFTEQVNSCRILLLETIPSGLFLDPYQLSSLQQHNLTEVVLLTSVDVEAPEYLSTGNIALVYAKPDQSCDHCFISTVPVHARYHRPSAQVHEVSLVLQNPQLLLHCGKESLPKGCSNYPFAEAPCEPTDDAKCQWLDVPYTAVTENIVLQVPVGIIQHGPAVCILTIVVTLLCTGMILTSVYKRTPLST
ncbi:GPI alpha-1,4-mannosyltransferase I, stabilizing subunit isoform X2 [Mixophyes fleayi]